MSLTSFPVFNVSVSTKNKAKNMDAFRIVVGSMSVHPCIMCIVLINLFWLLQAWVDAASQIFFSLSCGLGGLIVFGSYNDFNNNCQKYVEWCWRITGDREGRTSRNNSKPCLILLLFRDAITISLINCLTSFFGGFATFTVLGFVAHTLGKEVKHVISSGKSPSDTTWKVYGSSSLDYSESSFRMNEKSSRHENGRAKKFKIIENIKVATSSDTHETKFY